MGAGSFKMNLRRHAIPDTVARLLPYAEEWGIGDDYDREMKVSKASDSQLLDLVGCIMTIDRHSLFAWLEGPESYDPNPSEEYVAFTCLTMAIEAAKIKGASRN